MLSIQFISANSYLRFYYHSLSILSTVLLPFSIYPIYLYITFLYLPFYRFSLSIFLLPFSIYLSITFPYLSSFYFYLSIIFLPLKSFFRELDQLELIHLKMYFFKNSFHRGQSKVKGKLGPFTDFLSFSCSSFQDKNT